MGNITVMHEHVIAIHEQLFFCSHNSLCVKMELFQVVQTSNLDEVKQYITKHNLSSTLDSIFNKKSGDYLIHQAARIGKTDILQWLHEVDFHRAWVLCNLRGNSHGCLHQQ